MTVKRVLLVAALAGVLPKQQVHAMHNAQQPAIDQEYVNSVTQRVPEILDRVNAQELIDRVTREQEQREQAKQAALEARIQDQNTLLASTAFTIPIEPRYAGIDAQGNIQWQDHIQVPFGIYKRDLVEGGILAAQIAGEAAVNNKVQEYTQRHVLANIEKECQTLIDLLEKNLQAQENCQDEYDSLPAFKRAFTSVARQKALLFKPVRDYLLKHHTYIHKNIFKAELLPALSALLIGHKAVHKLKNTLIAEDGIPYFYQARYEQQADGTLRELGVDQAGQIDLDNPAPFSVLNLIKFITSPVNFINQVMSTLSHTLATSLMPGTSREYKPLSEAEKQDRLLSGLNKLFGLGVPSWLYSKGARAVGEALALGLAAKMHSNIGTTLWVQSIERNPQELLSLLRQYKAACENQDAQALENARKDLRQFIKKGHTVSRFPLVALYQWWAARDAKAKFISLLKGLPVYGILGWKAYQLYKNF